MGAQPVWCLFRVRPQDSAKVKKVFDQALKQSKIGQKLQSYLLSRKNKRPPSTSQFPELLRELYPQAFANIAELSDFFTWEDMDDTADFFFPTALRTMAERLFTGDNPILSSSMCDATLDLVTSSRFGVGQFLYAGLGWQRASRLPGVCGNMFVPPEELQEALKEIEAIFKEVDEEDFVARACAVGAGEDCDLEKLFLLPLGLSKILSEGHGFLALNYPHLGSFPFPDNEEYNAY